TVLSCYPGNSTCSPVGPPFGLTGGLVVAESPGLSQPFTWLVVDEYVPGIDTMVNSTIESQLVTGGTPAFLALNAKKTQLFLADIFYGRAPEYAYPRGNVLNKFAPASGDHPKQVCGVAVYPAGTYF